MNAFLPLLVVGAGIVAALVIGFDLFIVNRREARRQAQTKEARP
jgi:hypothetical protein